MRSALLPLILSGVPKWAVGTNLWKDFTVPRGPMVDPADTHAATIYAPDTTGLYSSFAANVLTRADLGLQCVPTRTELNSVPIPKTATWGKTNATITDNAVVAPDGTLTAATIARTSTLAAYAAAPTITKAASAVQYTMSVVAKAGTDSFLPMRLQGTYPARADACFNLSMGTVSSAASVSGTFTGASATITSLGNGWYLCTITATSDTATTLLGFVSCLTVTGQVDDASASATANLTVWYMNMQASAFAVAPILTGSATVNGNQQVIDLTGRLGTGVAGLVQFKHDGLASSTRILTINNGSSEASFLTLYNDGGTVAVYGQETGGASAIYVAGDALVAATTYTYAFAFGPNFGTLRRVGGTAKTPDTSFNYAAGASAFTNFSIGGRGYDTAVNSYQIAKKVALSFGAQDATTFDAMYARAVLAAAA